MAAVVPGAGRALPHCRWSASCSCASPAHPLRTSSAGPPPPAPRCDGGRAFRCRVPPLPPAPAGRCSARVSAHRRPPGWACHRHRARRWSGGGGARPSGLDRHVRGLCAGRLTHDLQPASCLRRLRHAGGTTRRVRQDPGHCLLVRLGRLVLGARTGSRPCGRVGGLAVRPVGRPLVELPVGQPVPDDLEGQEMLALLAQHPAQPLHVVVEELSVARRRSLGVHQALALEEADLRDRDVGEFLPEQGQDVTDGEVRTAAHSLPATR